RFADAAKIAQAMNWPLPPPVNRWKNVDLRGTAVGATADYKMTMKGSVDQTDVQLSGIYRNKTYTLSALLNNPRTAEGGAPVTGISIEKILHGGGAPYELFGNVTGTAQGFEMSNVKTTLADTPVTGKITRNGSAETAEMSIER